MPAPSVTFTFASGALASASQVNQNFTDVINGITDGTKALTVSSVNKLTLTAPSSSATLTIADGKVATVSNTLTFTGTDSSSVAFGTGGTVDYTALNQYNLQIGNSSNVKASTNTQLLGDVISQTRSQSATMTLAAPGVVTSNGHAMALGDKFYFTTTGALPTGVTASTTYYASAIAANTFNISTTFANAKAGTYVTTSGSQSGVHTLFMGGSTLTSGVKGVADASNATTGYVGETIESLQSSTGVGTSAQYFDATTITLTAGDWDVDAMVHYIVNGATISVSLFLMGLSTASGNDGTGLTLGQNCVEAAASLAAGFTQHTFTLPTVRVTSDGTNTVITGTSTASQTLRLKLYPGTYSVATPNYIARLTARRRR